MTSFPKPGKTWALFDKDGDLVRVFSSDRTAASLAVEFKFYIECLGQRLLPVTVAIDKKRLNALRTPTEEAGGNSDTVKDGA